MVASLLSAGANMPVAYFVSGSQLSEPFVKLKQLIAVLSFNTGLVRTLAHETRLAELSSPDFSIVPDSRLLALPLDTRPLFQPASTINDWPLLAENVDASMVVL